jgi:XTP/dITP diphosphohydrolase
MSRLFLASRNPKKLEELRRILSASVADVDVVGLDDVPAYDEVPETGATFAENALLKAREAAHRTALVAIADDSGLAVDALNGMPGVLSARWAGRRRDDAANLELVLDQLADVPPERRHAAFICAAAIATPNGVERVVEGRMHGVITTEPRGTRGFGYDPIFVAVGQTRTNAELSASEKDAISHRGQAFRGLAAILPQVLAEAAS